MTLERRIARLFQLTDENWRKHSNPWSVWTRYSVLPVIVVAFWSRAWIGWWCLVPGLASILWMAFNPVVFRPPRSTRNWASRSVLGERVYLNRDRVPIPDHHRSPIFTVLNVVSSIGMILAIWAIVTYSVWGAVMGVALAYLGKSWYLDRMAWLYEDMKTATDEYASWDY